MPLFRNRKRSLPLGSPGTAANAAGQRAPIAISRSELRAALQDSRLRARLSAAEREGVSVQRDGRERW